LFRISQIGCASAMDEEGPIDAYEPVRIRFFSYGERQ